jgi:hypothetical protein
MPTPRVSSALVVWPARSCGWRAGHAYRSASPGLPGARDVSFRANDGVRLAGWYVPGRNGATVIVLHGSHVSSWYVCTKPHTNRQRNPTASPPSVIPPLASGWVAQPVSFQGRSHDLRHLHPSEQRNGPDDPAVLMSVWGRNAS